MKYYSNSGNRSCFLEDLSNHMNLQILQIVLSKTFLSSLSDKLHKEGEGGGGGGGWTQSATTHMCCVLLLNSYPDPSLFTILNPPLHILIQLISTHLGVDC